MGRQSVKGETYQSPKRFRKLKKRTITGLPIFVEALNSHAQHKGEAVNSIEPKEIQKIKEAHHSRTPHPHRGSQ